MDATEKTAGRKLTVVDPEIRKSKMGVLLKKGLAPRQSVR